MNVGDKPIKGTKLYGEYLEIDSISPEKLNIHKKHLFYSIDNILEKSKDS